MTELVARLQVNLTHRVAGKVGGAEAKCDDFGCQRSLCGEGIGNWRDCVSGMKLLARGLELGALGG